MESRVKISVISIFHLFPGFQLLFYHIHTSVVASNTVTDDTTYWVIHGIFNTNW